MRHRAPSQDLRFVYSRYLGVVGRDISGIGRSYSPCTGNDPCWERERREAGWAALVDKRAYAQAGWLMLLFFCSAFVQNVTYYSRSILRAGRCCIPGQFCRCKQPYSGLFYFCCSLISEFILALTPFQFPLWQLIRVSSCRPLKHSLRFPCASVRP